MLPVGRQSHQQVEKLCRWQKVNVLTLHLCIQVCACVYCMCRDATTYIKYNCEVEAKAIKNPQ